MSSLSLSPLSCRFVLALKKDSLGRQEYFCFTNVRIKQLGRILTFGRNPTKAYHHRSCVHNHVCWRQYLQGRAVFLPQLFSSSLTFARQITPVLKIFSIKNLRFSLYLQFEFCQHILQSFAPPSKWGQANPSQLFASPLNRLPGLSVKSKNGICLSEYFKNRWVKFFIIKWDQAISASVAALSQLLQLSTKPLNCCQRTFIDIFGKKTFRKISLIFTPPQFFCLKLSRTNFHSSEPFIAK